MPRGQRRRTPKRSSRQVPTDLTLLDQFSKKDIHDWKTYQDNLLRFHWDYYSNLAYQRSKVTDQIRDSLLEVIDGPFKFSGWQRIVRAKYLLNPLSAEGSMTNPAGGRFNYGDINPTHFPPFPGFYIAVDKKTALQEAFGEGSSSKKALDAALTDSASISCFSLSGTICSIIDLRDQQNLDGFIDCIKDFTLPEALAPNWRLWPMQFDVPHPCQIFGQIVEQCGIEGIVYPSKFSGKDCLVIYYQNFDDENGSYVQLDDEVPTETKIIRVDAKTWPQMHTVTE